MKPIIKPSSLLRKNYQDISNLCKKEGQPVFLTVNGEGDTVIMDLNTYERRERELALAARLLAAERRRQAGDTGYTPNQLEASLDEAIRLGEETGTAHGA